MDTQSLDKRLNDLLVKIQAGETPPASSFNLLAEEKAFLEEALERLRRRFAQEKEHWAQLLAERDAALTELKERIRRHEEDAAKTREEQSSLRADLETRLEMLSLEKSAREADIVRHATRHEEELALYQRQIEDIERSRLQDAGRHAAAIARWEAEEKSWAEALRKSQEEAVSLQTRLSRLEAQRQTDRVEFGEEKRRLEASLREETARAIQEAQALRASLENRELETANFQRLLQLSQEEIAEFTRRIHSHEKELKLSHEHIARLESDLRTMREAWEMERGHWRELWERERGSREKWYDNMREWETHLRSERETWLEQFRAEAEARERINQKVERHVDRLKEIVWSLPVFSNLGLAKSGPSAAGGARPGRLSIALPGRTVRARPFVLAGVLAAGFLVTFAIPRFAPAEFSSPTPFLAGLAAQDRNLWFTDWMSGQLLESPARNPEKVRSFGSQTPDLHPVSVRWASDRLWTLDVWKRVLTEHRPLPPFSPLRSWPLPVENAVDFAWDGQGFWILSQGDPTLRRFPLGNFSTPDRESPLPPEWRLAALDHHDGEFWAYDDAVHRLRRFTLFPQLEVRAEYPLPVHEGWTNPLTGLAVTEDAVWTVSEKSLTLFRWSPRGLAWNSFLRRKLPAFFGS